LKSFHNSRSISEENTEKSDDFKNTVVLFKTQINKTYFKSILDDTRFPVKHDKLKEKNLDNFTKAKEYNSDKELFPNVTDKVITIAKGGNFAECMDTIIQYKNKLGKHFYGALLRPPTKQIINPFHILTALSIMEDDTYLQKNYSITIYVHSDREELDKYMMTYAADYNKINSNIDSLINMYVDRVPTITKITSRGSSNYPSEHISAQKQTKKFPDEDPDANHYIIAHQLMTDGVFAPFYGTSLIRLNGNAKAMAISPFRSCNIAFPSGGYDIKNNTAEYDSICVGRHDAKTLSGLRYLNHAYLGSPFGGKFMAPGSLAYADEMIERCIDLFEKAGLVKHSNVVLDRREELDAYEVEEEYIFSSEELKAKTLKEYIELYQISEDSDDYDQIKERWYEVQDKQYGISQDTKGYFVKHFINNYTECTIVGPYKFNKIDEDNRIALDKYNVELYILDGKWTINHL